MNEALIKSWEELKRADHLIYVSLKYTRTVDVIKSIVERLINAYDFIILAILEKAEHDNKIFEIPQSPIQKANTIRELYPEDKIICQYMKFYLVLRKILRANTSAAKEFRRHVTMTVNIEEGDVEVNIDIIHEYYDKVRDFFDYIRNSDCIEK